MGHQLDRRNVHVEKHAGYCAAIRLGFDVPATWLLPHKVPPENERFAPTASRYNRAFDLGAVGERVGARMSASQPKTTRGRTR